MYGDDRYLVMASANYAQAVNSGLPKYQQAAAED